MAIARARRDSGLNYWPGFVDALSTLVLGIIFLLTVFMVVQFYLTQEVTGKDTVLARLNAQLAQLTELLSLEKTGKLSLEEEIAQMRSSLMAIETERDRYRSLYEGVGAGAADAQGKAAELTGQLGGLALRIGRSGAHPLVEAAVAVPLGLDRHQARAHLGDLFLKAELAGLFQRQQLGELGELCVQTRQHRIFAGDLLS